MRKVTEIKGNLITLARQNKFDVIAHGCNCFCTMGAGIAPQMAKEFDADDFHYEAEEYKGDYNKLGTIDYVEMYLQRNTGNFDPKWHWTYMDEYGINDEAYGEELARVTVVNAYTQYGFGRNHKEGTGAPIDYVALTMVMRKINHIFKGQHIGLPWIGAGLAGGDWKIIRSIILDKLKDCDVTLVEYDNK